MRDLLQCRDDIDRIDTQVLELLRERMEVANDIAEYKLVHNQSITDAKRELLKLKTLRQKAEDLGLPPSYISDVYKLIMSNTCAIERHYIVAKANNQGIVRDTSVSYLGNTGSYSHVAARKYLEGFKGKVETTGCPGFSEIVSMVETGKTEYGVLPIENSSSGSINDVLDVIQDTKASIVGELLVPIDHAVLGVDGCSLDKITDIYSHPQPVAQCSAFIKNMLPNATVHYTKATSEAMTLVKEKNDPAHVAIGSHMAADLYDLMAVSDGISNNPNNYTRFIVIALNPITVPDNIEAKTSLTFSVKKYQPGSLIKVLSLFSEHNINMTKLISRPKINAQSDTWEEIFFTDLEVNASSSVMQDILEQMKEYTNSLKVLGCYPNPEKK